MIKAVIIGFAHMHVNEIALYISEQPDTKLVGIADVRCTPEEIPPLRYTHSWNLENVRKNFCQTVYEDYKEMLDAVKPDIAYILCENCLKTEIVEECAKRHVNVSIEKPIAVSLEEAKKMKESVHKYGIEAVVNWPVFWRGYIQKLKAALDQKLVGEPISLRYLNGHTGPLGKGAKHRGVNDNAEEMTDEQRSQTWWHKEACGGGVFMDICCYGCLFTRWLLGEGAQSVLAYGANLNTPFGDTADNCAVIIKYDDKMSVVEGTWTTPRVMIPSGPMVVCTEGVITCTGGAEDMPDVKACDSYGNEVPVPEWEMGEEFRNMPWHYAHHVKNGAPLNEILTLDKNVEIMAMLDAAVKSAGSGREVKIGE